MGLSQRHTATIYTWSGLERSWTPGGVWSLLQWLGNLLPVAWLLLRLGLKQANEAASDPAITNFLSAINTESQRQHQLPPTPNYQPQTVTTDGWKTVQNAWQSQVSSINLLECRWHGRQRIDRTLKDGGSAAPRVDQRRVTATRTEIWSSGKLHLLSLPTLKGSGVYMKPTGMTPSSTNA